MLLNASWNFVFNLVHNYASRHLNTCCIGKDTAVGRSLPYIAVVGAIDGRIWTSLIAGVE